MLTFAQNNIGVKIVENICRGCTWPQKNLKKKKKKKHYEDVFKIVFIVTLEKNSSSLNVEQ